MEMTSVSCATGVFLPIEHIQIRFAKVGIVIWQKRSLQMNII
nr:MAG TPA_asm: hypothetical protein [Caudoviricetes sp.]